jgi:dethiobiotin synthetase
MHPRPKKLVGVIGTQTDIGKTYVSSRWLLLLREQGLKVAARKPVQSFDNDANTDAMQLATATGEYAIDVCPQHRNYPLALAPPMAADVLQRPRIHLGDLLLEMNWPAHIDVGLVETVGGPLSPLAHDGDCMDFLARVQPDLLLLIADAGLGTLNAVRLALSCVAQTPLRLTKLTVFLNRYDEENTLHRLNRQWLQENHGVNAISSVANIKLN